MLLETPTSSAIKQILYKQDSHSFDITFNNGTSHNYTALPKDFDKIKLEFTNTTSVGKTFHKLVNAGLLSVNGNII